MNFFKNHLPCIIEITIIIAITIIALKLVDFLDKRIRQNIINKHENSSRLLSFCPIVNKVMKALLLFIIVASVMQAHGYSMTSLIAGFGIAGIAVGFAAQETVANVFGSFAILYDKIYDIGDYIVVNGVEGTVIDINLRSTKIKTLDNAIVTLPNNTISQAIVTNITSTTQRRINEVIGITYDTSNEKIIKAIEILKNILNSNSEIDEHPIVYLEQLNASSIDIHIMAYINYPDIDNFRRIRENVIIETVKQFRQEGIDFAFPSQTLYINKNEN